MRAPFFFLSATIIFFTLTACTYFEKITRDKKETKQEEIKKEEIKSEKIIDKKAELKQKIIDLLNRKEYLQALNLINREAKNNLSATYFDKEYVIAINESIESGENNFQKKDYEQAGIIFRKVLENYPRENSLRIKVKKPPEAIESYIEICSKELMDQGLMEYRRGNLAKAIDAWKKILLFNPDYPDAKKAIETASIQLKNIK